MKHTILCKEYEQGGLKDVDIFSKITSLRSSWIKGLYGDSFHTWKVIPLYLIENHLDKNFIFHSNLSIKQKIVEKFLKLTKLINQETLTGTFFIFSCKIFISCCLSIYFV